MRCECEARGSPKITSTRKSQEQDEKVKEGIGHTERRGLRRFVYAGKKERNILKDKKPKGTDVQTGPEF